MKFNKDFKNLNYTRRLGQIFSQFSQIARMLATLHYVIRGNPSIIRLTLTLCALYSLPLIRKVHTLLVTCMLLYGFLCTSYLMQINAFIAFCL